MTGEKAAGCSAGTHLDRGRRWEHSPKQGDLHHIRRVNADFKKEKG